MEIAVVYFMSLFTPKQNNANQNNSKMVFGVALIKNKSFISVGLERIKAHIKIKPMAIVEHFSAVELYFTGNCIDLSWAWNSFDMETEQVWQNYLGELKDLLD